MKATVSGLLLSFQIILKSCTSVIGEYSWFSPWISVETSPVLTLIISLDHFYFLFTYWLYFLVVFLCVYSYHYPESRYLIFTPFFNVYVYFRQLFSCTDLVASYNFLSSICHNTLRSPSHNMLFKWWTIVIFLFIIIFVIYGLSN